LTRISIGVIFVIDMIVKHKQMGPKMKKVTFNTLKALANKGRLAHRIRGAHGPYGMEFYNGEEKLPVEDTTIADLKKFKATKNFIQTENLENFCDGPFGAIKADAQLSNCIYYVIFYFKTEEA